jgi:hypothetical protein
MKKSNLPLCALLLTSLFAFGFSMDNAIVPKEKILSGGPPKDGIPALLAPQFINPKQATFLARNDEVIGVTINGESKAYPIKILNWHEAVNDTLGGEAIVVTF